MTRKITLLLGLLILPLTFAMAQDNIAADPERMEQRIKALSQFGANEDGGVDRVAFSEAVSRNFRPSCLARTLTLFPAPAPTGMIFVPSVPFCR